MENSLRLTKANFLYIVIYVLLETFLDQRQVHDAYPLGFRGGINSKLYKNKLV